MIEFELSELDRDLRDALSTVRNNYSEKGPRSREALMRTADLVIQVRNALEYADRPEPENPQWTGLALDISWRLNGDLKDYQYFARAIPPLIGYATYNGLLLGSDQRAHILVVLTKIQLAFWDILHDH